jgi:ABC-type uncharacterized transport system auxiliary subunit
MAPQRIITDTDKAPLVQVLALMCAVVALLACCVRTATKIGMIKSLKVDDLLVIAATVRLHLSLSIPPPKELLMVFK